MRHFNIKTRARMTRTTIMKYYAILWNSFNDFKVKSFYILQTPIVYYGLKKMYHKLFTILVEFKLLLDVIENSVINV